jgi:hypothetical protein
VQTIFNFCDGTHIKFRGLLRNYTENLNVQQIKNLVIKQGVPFPKRNQWVLGIDSAKTDEAFHFHDGYIGFLRKLMSKLSMNLHMGIGVVQKCNTILKPYPQNKHNDRDFTVFVGLEQRSSLYVYKSASEGTIPECISYTNGDVIIANETLISANGDYQTHHLHEMFLARPFHVDGEVPHFSETATSSSSTDAPLPVGDTSEIIE